jgi:serine/threonine protein kinase
MRCEYCLRGERESDGICPLCRFDGVPRNEAPFLPEGTAVGDRYVLGRQEGHGGFSICYRAWDNVNEEMVAIKELFPWEVAERLNTGTVGINPEHRSDFDTAVNSLRHEGEVLRKLTKEPGIVRVGDVFQDNDTAYLPMEYLRGQSYEKYLQNQYARNQAHLDVEAAVNVALTVLGALDAVHARGLLHLDVKPANIRVLDDGRIVLLDFGSARDAFRQGNGPYGDTFTPGFAALEQHYASGSVTAATDVHGLAATLYYSLSLRMPTRADEREEGAVPPALSELNPAVSEALDFIIQKAMALAPEDRYPSVNSLRMALEPFGTMRRSPAPRLSAPSPVRIVAGLLDVVTVMLLLAALTAGLLVPPEQVIVTGALLWWITQLLPFVTKATPGMLVMGLRLTDQNGGAITLRALLFRTSMLIVTIITLRFRSDSRGLFMHDRVSGSGVVLKLRNR